MHNQLFFTEVFTILLIVHLGMVLLLSGDWIIPFVMASSAAWWYGFALLTFKWVPEPPIKDEMDALGFRESAGLALKEIRKTISEVHKFRTLFIYMLAYFFFIDLSLIKEINFCSHFF